MSDTVAIPPHGINHLRVIRQAVSAPGRYIRAWYLAYLLLGVITAGMIPVLLPLMMISISHALSTVAYVMGGFNLGLLTSPLWGLLAERYKLYHPMFFIGFLLVGIATAIMPWLSGLAAWLPAAFVIGAGSAGAATVASLFIVDFTPAAEWEPRIGYLQSFNGAGQVLGLLLAGVFAHGLFSPGLWVGALLMIPALFFGRMGLPVVQAKPGAEPHRAHIHRHLDMRALAAFPHLNFLSSVGYHFHEINLHGLRRIPQALGTPFARFILSWFMLALGVAAFFTYFPLMLAKNYGINANLSSIIYAITAAVGIVLYIFASRWSERLGSARVYHIGLWLRQAGFVLLLIPFITSEGPTFALGAIGFILIVVTWPLLSVAGTGLAAHLAPFSEGEAMGLFNAALALATVIGTFASGPLVHYFGFAVIPVMALIGISCAIMLGLRLPAKQSAPTL
jgi:MFS family permease